MPLKKQNKTKTLTTCKYFRHTDNEATTVQYTVYQVYASLSEVTLGCEYVDEKD